MPEYEYEAMDRFGVLIRAAIEAPDRAAAISKLLDDGLEPRSVEEIARPAEPVEREPRPAAPADRRPLADPPGFAPRELDGFGWTYLFGSMRAKFGIPFVVVGVVAVTFAWRILPAAIFGLFFAAIGLRILQVARSEARNRLQAWRHGTAVQGRVTAIGSDTSIRINGRPAFLIEFAFDIGGTTHRGRRSTFNPAATAYATDEAIWVVHDPEDPHINAIWPPIR